jgi:hypothetical protein
MTALNQLGDLVQQLAERHGLRGFVETGCFEGDALALADSLGFSPMMSCDTCEHWVEIARQRVPTAEIAHLDSVTFLRSIVTELDCPSLFWLDAHYPQFYDRSQSDSKRTKLPLYEELCVIATRPSVQNDVVLCDDIRVISSGDNPVYWQALEGSVLGQTPGYFIERRFKLSDFRNVLAKTHESELLPIGEGIMAFYPR